MTHLYWSDEYPHRLPDQCDHVATFVEDGLIQCYMCVATFATDAEMFASRSENVDRILALAAATGTAKTPKAVECEASQSGLKGNAHD